MSASLQNSIAAFDLDGTLLTCNSSFAFCRYLVAKRELKAWQMIYCATCYLCHLYLRLSLTSLHQHVFERLFRGKNVKVLERIAHEFLDESLDHKLYYPAIQLLNDFKQKGAKIVIFSNSPFFLVKLIASRLGVEESTGTEYLVDEMGNLTGVGAIIDGDKKRLLLKSLASTHGSTKTLACSDTLHDRPFLEAASVPIAINPKYSLKRLAKKRGWLIV